MSKKIKVYYLLKEAYGGANTFIKILLKTKKKNFTLNVFCFEKNKHSIKRITYLTNDLTTSFFPTPRKFILFIKNIILSLNLLKRERPNIIITGDNYTFILLHTIKLFLGYNPIFILRVGNNLTKLIYTKPIYLYKKLLLFLIKYFVNKTHFFICCSKSGSIDFNKSFQPPKDSKIKVIYNGINLKKTKLLADKSIKKNDQVLLNNEYLKIISVGRFHKQKDFFTLIKAFNIVHNVIPLCKLYLIGDGDLKSEIIELIAKLGLNKSVILLGWKKNIYPYLKKADLFVHSSNYEGFPFAILEAMSQGLPIISTDTPFGPSEILDKNKYGIIVPTGNPNIMADKIITLLKDNNLINKFSKLSSQRIKFFAEKKTSSKYLNFFKQLIYEKTN